MPVDYQAQYLALAEPSNDVLDDLTRAQELATATLKARRWWRRSATFDAPQVQKARRLYGEVAASKVAFYEGLVAADWPARIQPDVDALVAELAAEAQAYQAASKATSFAEGRAALDDLPKGSNPAGVIRAKLGLESNVNL